MANTTLVKLLEILDDGRLRSFSGCNTGIYCEPLLCGNEFPNIDGIHALRFGETALPHSDRAVVALCEIPDGTKVVSSAWEVYAERLLITRLRLTRPKGFIGSTSLRLAEQLTKRWYSHCDIEVISAEDSASTCISWLRRGRRGEVELKTWRRTDGAVATLHIGSLQIERAGAPWKVEIRQTSHSGWEFRYWRVYRGLYYMQHFCTTGREKRDRHLARQARRILSTIGRHWPEDVTRPCLEFLASKTDSVCKLERPQQ